MPTNKLNEAQIRKVKCGKKTRKLFDGGSMYLELNSNGGKYWRMNYQFRKKENTLAFGVWPDVSLVEARKKRDEAKMLLKAGKDPSNEKKKLKANAVQDQGNTFNTITEEWFQRMKHEWSKDYFSDSKRAFELHVLPFLKDIPISEIEHGEIKSVLRRMEDQKKFVAAKKVIQKLDRIFKYANLNNYCKHNPVAPLKGTLISPKKKNQPALEDSDLPQFLKKLDEADLYISTKLGLRLVLLTLARTKEIRFSTWDEFDLESEKPLWKIPADRMKMHRDHMIPLSRQAVVVLRELKWFVRDNHYVFEQHKNPKKPMSENTMLYALYRMGFRGKATVHGFRATASTILNEKGYRSDVIELLLAHVEKNQVRAAYNRAEYLDERREVLQWWADYLDSLNVSIEQEEPEQEEEKLKMWKGGNLY